MNYHRFSQHDKRWKNKPYPSKKYKFKKNGCGCCACTHVVIQQRDHEKLTPEDLRVFMVAKGYAEGGHGTHWNGITGTLKHYGNKAITHSSMASMFATLNLRNTKRGVILFKKGKKGGVRWTYGGHYVAFIDYKIKDGKHWLYMVDSSSRNNTGWYCYEHTMQGLVKKCWSALPNENYKVGKTYTCNYRMNIREKASLQAKALGKRRKGSKIKVQEIKKVNGRIWLKDSKGWTVAKSKKKYIGE